MPRCSIVIDLGFGDSGKGLTTDYLASQSPSSSLVIRFSGGHQVGHTVTTEEISHTFSNFGSGTFRGVPTFYTEHTTIFPPAILLEGKYLEKYHPQLIFHPHTMVTTAYDIAYNRAIEKQNQHGSCGLGFGATIERNRQEVYFFAQDLPFEWVVKERLKSIKNYYQKLIDALGNKVKQLYKKELETYHQDDYVQCCQSIEAFYGVKSFSEIQDSYDHFIFEGSQGIMLDTKHGFHPHTTWSNTTSKNAIELLVDHFGNAQSADLYYVTRCYQTRHGNGPMSSTPEVQLQNHEKEANVTNEFQGEFRTTALDPELLNYALTCDKHYHHNLPIRKKLIITCLDQLPSFSVESILSSIRENFESVLGSYGPNSSQIKHIYTT
ncbi:adenylosuccinate synthetase [Fulvivirga sediminis]|uniref:Adenylosuccinate synthetase n=1 Tax=Fulvivirga sediminis TaxID=2803949 RepID=A0A937FB38_9BACT|nr:adenylosuccinate synthetase [Fulvivirga sediminis]MBL3657914.1 adenylosuccinate synthetase [Fulvivirga sediminis]